MKTAARLVLAAVLGGILLPLAGCASDPEKPRPKEEIRELRELSGEGHKEMIPPAQE